MEKIYVIGHMNPDTDSVVSAISMAAFLNLRERTNKYKAAMSGNPNSETEYIFDRFGLEFPEKIDDATGKKLFLVDHNEESQSVKGRQNENILGFTDHHKIKFESSIPLEITVKPWGSSNTVIYDLFKKELLDIPDEIKPAMLCAVLSDTVILKSPTTTPVDMMVVEELSEDLQIDYQKLGMELFKAKANLGKKTALEILKNDFKDFYFNSKKTGIGQIEAADLNDIEDRFTEIITAMKELKEKSKYHSIILMLTDIIQEGSKLAVVSDEKDKIAKIFSTKIKDNLSDFIPGMMSRKKQVAPVMNDNL
jgi:manganese-dependent inorganic pyrophosphatase